MELKNVKLVERLAIDSGTTKAGKPWKKQVIIVEETQGQYPKQVAITLWNDLIDKVAARKDGEVLDCNIKIESREYNGRWYTDVAAISVNGQSPATPPSKAAPVAEPENDLPF